MGNCQSSRINAIACFPDIAEKLGYIVSFICSDNDGPSMENQDESETVRVNISMQRHERRDMKRLAHDHFGGRLSQFIRAAVQTKKRQLNGIRTAELKKMRSNVSDLEKEVEDMHEILDNLNMTMAGIGGGISQSESMNHAVSNPEKTNAQRVNDSRLAIEIMDVIQKNQPTIMETIVSETNSELPAVYQKTGELVNKGAVTCIGQNDNDPQYKLAEAMT